MARIGSRGRARTESAVEALTVLLKEHQQLSKRPWLTTLNTLVLLMIARLRHNTTILCRYTSPTPSLHFLTQFITHLTTQFGAQFVFESASWYRGKPSQAAMLHITWRVGIDPFLALFRPQYTIKLGHNQLYLA